MRTSLTDSRPSTASINRPLFCAPRTGDSRIPAFGDDFLARHWILRRPAHRFDALAHAAAIGKGDLHDGDPLGQLRLERRVRHQLDFFPALRIRGSCMRGLSCAARNDAVLSSSITATMCCMQMSGISRLSTSAASLVATRTMTWRTASCVERPLLQQILDGVERRLNRRADRPLLDVRSASLRSARRASPRASRRSACGP